MLLIMLKPNKSTNRQHRKPKPKLLIEGKISQPRQARPWARQVQLLWWAPKPYS